MSSVSRTCAPEESRVVAWLLSPRGVLVVFALYSLAHFGLRLVLSPTLGLDDAEQAMFSQELLAGYRFRQPPFYTWLVWFSVAAFGLNLFSLFLVKYLILFAGYAAFLFAARRWIGDDRRAALATYSLLLIYVFAYYLHHDLTHTVVVATMIGVAFHALALAIDRGRWGDFAYLGLALGGGILSKYNFGLFIACAALAAVFVPAIRPRLYRPRALLSLGIFLAIAVPYLVWVYRHDYSFQNLTQDVVHAADGVSYLSKVGEGLLELPLKLLEFPQPFLVIVLATFPAMLLPGRYSRDDAGGKGRFLALHMIVGVALLVASVLFFGATQFKARWFHPVLMALPLYMFARIDDRALSRRRIAAFLGIVSAVTLFIFAARVVVDRVAPHHCGSCRTYLPFADVADDLAALGFDGGTVVMKNFHIGGNLRLLWPETRLVDVRYPYFLWGEATGEGQCLVVWQDETEEIPPMIAAYLEREMGVTELPEVREGTVTAGLLGAPERTYVMSYVLIEGGAGDCR
ncbi:glycosyltransferase family 39 protein [Inquilinus sp. CAU 1745]|uniref:ArnT family glycosyltransferase n=1 Tax=Inquilinus sp. CAU 1745 TaxID=3140369 RepID=UPI00325A4BBB